MKRIEATDAEAQSADIVADNLSQLKRLFPEAFTEGKVQFDTLRQLLGGAVEEADEKYGLNWHGKRRARQIALTPSTGTLRPCPSESVDWDTTQNLMIEGDNLEVLKLLQKSYARKAKLVYIDPPYNTGSDFVYPDNFQDGLKNYLEITGQLAGGEPISSNKESSGRFHTNWLNMLYPRLRLGWSLLREDGFLLVSIDDKEFYNLRMLLNEICGEENFLATLVFDKNRKNDAKFVSSGHEYMVLYARNKQLLTELDVRLRAPKEGVDEVRELFDELRKERGDNWGEILAGLKKYYTTFVEDDPRLPLTRFTKVDKRGPYRDDGDPSWPGGGGPRYDVPHPVTGRPCTVPSRGWVWPTYERMKQEIDAGNIVFGEDEKRIPSIRRDLFIKDEQVLRSVIFSYAQKATQDFASLFDGKAVFQNPKSYRDLQRLVSYLTSPGDLVVDFFAGSGTTGHGVMLSSTVAEQPRRFLLIQIPELLDPADKEQKIAADFCDQISKPRTIAELTKERLRRAGQKVKTDNPLFVGDIGFRVFKLDKSNLRLWNPNPDGLAQSLLDHHEHIVEGRTEADIVYELLLKLGLDLCVPMESHDIAGKAVSAVGGGVLMLCLAEKIAAEEVEPLAGGIVAWHKELTPAGDATVVFRDSAFANDVAKTNMAAILAQNGLENVRSL